MQIPNITAKYPSGTFLKANYSKMIYKVTSTRVHTFMNETYVLYTVKEFGKERNAVHSELTEYQLEGLYTVCPEAQVLYGNKSK